MTPILRGMLTVLPVLALAACTTPGDAVTTTTRASSSYDVPLTASPTASSTDALVGWPGAAGKVVRCAGPVVGTTRAAPYDGEDTGASSEALFRVAKEWGTFDGAQHGYALARTEGGRRLYVLEVDGVAKQALILRHGPALKGDGTRTTVTRWWIESWARCDYAELPDSVARERGLELWTGADGKRALTSAVMSFRFTAGCYPGMRALDIGGPTDGGWNEKQREPVEYVQHPAAELRDEYFRAPYLEHVAVPADAIDSAYARDGRHLWFSHDREYAYVGSQDDADAWPRAVHPIRCL